MSSLQRTLLGLVAGLTAAGAAWTQPQGGIRWPGAGHAPLGLQAGEATVLPLYFNKPATRSLNMQVGPLEAAGAATLWDTSPSQGLSVSLVGKAELAYDLGVYGRLGTTLGGPPALAGALPAAPGQGLSYGVGLSWDFSERGSAILGWDSLDLRTVTGERDVRATSLGLKWRY